MTSYRTAFVFCAMLTAPGLTFATTKTTHADDERKPRVESAVEVHGALEFQPILSRDYANFPVNWSAKERYRLGLIRTPEQYDQVFQPAAVAGNTKPYSPTRELFEREMIVVVGRVTRAPRDIDKALEIKQIVVHDKTLVVTFTFRPGPQSAKSSAKVTGVARFAKQDIDRVVFMEDNEEVGELRIAEGQWLIPEPITE